MHRRNQIVFDKPEDPAGTPAAAAAATPTPAPASAPEPAASPAAVVADPATPPAAGASTTPAAGTPAAAPAKKDWKDARIAELTAKLNKKEPAPVPQGSGESDADFQARVDAAATEKAVEMAALNDWNRQCANIADAGRAAFPDFNDRLAALHTIVNGQDLTEVTQYNEVLATMMETGKAPQLIYALGENPGEYKRLMGLSPVKRAMELAGMATKLDSAPAPSEAPKPITPVGSSGLHYEGIKASDPAKGMKLPMKQWMKQREEEAREAGIQ